MRSVDDLKLWAYRLIDDQYQYETIMEYCKDIEQEHSALMTAKLPNELERMSRKIDPLKNNYIPEVRE